MVGYEVTIAYDVTITFYVSGYPIDSVIIDDDRITINTQRVVSTAIKIVIYDPTAWDNWYVT